MKITDDYNIEVSGTKLLFYNQLFYGDRLIVKAESKHVVSRDKIR
jgi:hypothetical protein